MSDSHAAEAHAEEHHEHIVSVGLLATVLGALLVLTVITVLVAQVHLGELNLFVALVVALIKGSLVVLYFMHLRWDSLFNAVALISALAFVSLFIGLSCMDTGQYKANVTAYTQNPVNIKQIQPATKTPAQSPAEPKAGD